MSDQDILDLINGAGTEDLRTAAPVLEVIQKGSPQVDATHKDYKTKCIDGAVPGDIILTSTNTIVKKAKDKKAELEFTLLAIGKCYVEFKPKTEGGGFVAIHPLSVVSKREYRKGDGTEKGKYREFLGKNELQYTATLFGTILIDGVKTKVMVRLKSTQLRKLRELEKMVASFRWDGVKQVPPMFARKWLVSTVAESNDAGGWFGWNFDPGTVVKPTDTGTLKELYADYQDAVKAREDMNAPRLSAPGAAPALEDKKGNSAGDDADVPF